VLKAVDFIPVSGRKVLCIVVSSTGFIDNKVIETGRKFPARSWCASPNYLTESFCAHTLREIRERLLRQNGRGEGAGGPCARPPPSSWRVGGFSVGETPGVMVDAPPCC